MDELFRLENVTVAYGTQTVLEGFNLVIYDRERIAICGPSGTGKSTFLRCLNLLEGYDLLLTPTLQCVAPPTGIGDLALRERLIANTIPFNTLGWPALALPCGSAEDGLPASVQLIGRPGADALVLAAGSRLASLI